MNARIRMLFLTAVATATSGCGPGGGQPLFQLGPNPEAMEEYTILLSTMTGPQHVQQAKYYREQTDKDTHWPGLFVVHKDEHSELFWGKYASHADARKDLKKAKDYRTAIGIPVYAQAMIVPLPGKGFGPPEWDLLNAKGEYTVVVAVFYDVPQAKYYGRKNHAVVYCRQLREKGEEAYYHHGPSQSSVTIGLFPASAVQMVEQKETVRPVIVEPRIEAIVAKYPKAAVNGYAERQAVIDPVTGKAKREWAKPYPVHIPRREEDQPANAFDYRGDSESR